MTLLQIHATEFTCETDNVCARHTLMQARLEKSFIDAPGPPEQVQMQKENENA